MDTLDKILYLIKSNNLSDKEFTEKIGVYPSALTEWKRGKTISYRKHLPKIAALFNMPTEYFTCDDIFKDGVLFVQRFKEIRKENEMPDRWVAAYLEITIEDINFWDTGIIPPKNVIDKICKFYNISEDYLLGKTDICIPIRELSSQSINFKDCRIYKHLTRKQLSKEIGIPLFQITAWELDVATPDLQDYVKYSNFFGVSIDYLLGKSDTPSTPTREQQDEFSELLKDCSPDEREQVKKYIEFIKSQRTK